MTTSNRAARLSNRVAHQPAGILSGGEVLTICGRTLRVNDPRFVWVEDVTSLPLRQHCLKCWG